MKPSVGCNSHSLNPGLDPQRPAGGDAAAAGEIRFPTQVSALRIILNILPVPLHSSCLICCGVLGLLGFGVSETPQSRHSTAPSLGTHLHTWPASIPERSRGFPRDGLLARPGSQGALGSGTGCGAHGSAGWWDALPRRRCPLGLACFLAFAAARLRVRLMSRAGQWSLLSALLTLQRVSSSAVPSVLLPACKGPFLLLPLTGQGEGEPRMLLPCQAWECPKRPAGTLPCAENLGARRRRLILGAPRCLPEAAAGLSCTGGLLGFACSPDKCLGRAPPSRPTASQGSGAWVSGAPSLGLPHFGLHGASVLGCCRGERSSPSSEEVWLGAQRQVCTLHC